MDYFLAKLEDPKRPFLGPNYWSLMKSGILLPKNLIAKSIYLLIAFLCAIFVISEYVELYVIRLDLQLVLNTLRITMLSMVAIVKVTSAHFWQKEWKEVLDYVTFADKIERDHQDEARGVIIKSYTQYSRRMTYFYWSLSLSTCIAADLVPLMKYMSSSTFRENFNNGTEDFPHVLFSWMPFDKNQSPGCWITIVWHAFVCFYGNFYIGSFDSCVIVLMVFFGGKIDLLRERCKQMFEGCMNAQDNLQFRKSIREIHDIHINLIKYSRQFNSVLSPALFLYIAVCSLMLCTSIYQFNSAATAAEQVMLAQYLMFGIAQLFLLCWHSNNVLLRSENLSFGVYDSNWCTSSVQQRRDLLILQSQLRTNVVFAAGPFTNLTLPTFIHIVKAAYSYYTLIRQ